MALKSDRVEAYTDISYFCNSTAERGGVAVHLTGGSGVAMDDAGAAVVVHSARAASIDDEAPGASAIIREGIVMPLVRFEFDRVRVPGLGLAAEAEVHRHASQACLVGIADGPLVVGVIDILLVEQVASQLGCEGFLGHRP